MSPEQLLDHHDRGQLWPSDARAGIPSDLGAAYQQALAVRRLRAQRGERPRGYKIGFTNRSIWPLYQVYAPIWGTVWEGGLVFCDGEGQLDLAATCQPRIEPEVVFGLRATPAPDATPDQLLDAIEWLAPGFEVVQSHCPDWRFVASETVADSGLHARLLVGPRVPVRSLAADAAGLNALLARTPVTLLKNGQAVVQGQGAAVLDSPLLALHHFLNELRQCPGATDLQAGDVVTTGTWTDAFAIAAGEQWTARFAEPLPSLTVKLT
jgi:2-oxo-3-hexenedioate decarboxylase